MVSQSGVGRPQSASPYIFSWNSGFDDDFGSVGPRATTAGSIGGRARTPGLTGTSRPSSPGGGRCNTPSLRPEFPVPKLRIITVLRDRDKESLIEEITDLKKIIHDQQIYLKRQKIYESSLRLQNRKLEKNVDNLEMLGAKGPRTGAPTRLRAILQGLKLKLGSLEATCDSQQEEIFQLQKDIRVTITRETQIERDIFAGEFGRLQLVVRQLKKSHTRLSTENKELARMREEIARLESANQRLEFSIQASQNSIIKAHRDMEDDKEMADNSIKEAKMMYKMCAEFQERGEGWQMLIDNVRKKKQKLTKKIWRLTNKISRIEKLLMDHNKRVGGSFGLSLRGGGPSFSDASSSTGSSGISSTSWNSIYGGGVENGSKASKILKDRINEVADGQSVALPVNDEGCQTYGLSASRKSADDEVLAETVEENVKAAIVPKLNLKKLKPLQPREITGKGSEDLVVDDVDPIRMERPPSRLAFADADTPKSNSSCPPQPPQEEQQQQVQYEMDLVKHGVGDMNAFRLRGGCRRLEPVLEESIQDDTVAAAERKNRSSSSSNNKNSNSRRRRSKSCSSSKSSASQLSQVQDEQKNECIAWLNSIELGVEYWARPPSSSSKEYAEDTLQMLHLDRKHL